VRLRTPNPATLAGISTPDRAAFRAATVDPPACGPWWVRTTFLPITYFDVIGQRTARHWELY
jgi:hypothetical protein